MQLFWFLLFWGAPLQQGTPNCPPSPPDRTPPSDPPAHATVAQNCTYPPPTVPTVPH